MYHESPWLKLGIHSKLHGIEHHPTVRAKWNHSFKARMFNASVWKLLKHGVRDNGRLSSLYAKISLTHWCAPVSHTFVQWLSFCLDKWRHFFSSAYFYHKFEEDLIRFWCHWFMLTQLLVLSCPNTYQWNDCPFKSFTSKRCSIRRKKYSQSAEMKRERLG